MWGWGSSYFLKPSLVCVFNNNEGYCIVDELDDRLFPGVLLLDRLLSLALILEGFMLMLI